MEDVWLGRFKGRSFLVADDDRSVRSLIATVFHLTGAEVREVVTVADLEAQLDQVRSGALLLHTIVADYHLSDGTLAQLIANVATLPGPLLLVVTTGARVSVPVGRTKNIAVRLLRKPFTVDELCTAVADPPRRAGE